PPSPTSPPSLHDALPISNDVDLEASHLGDPAWMSDDVSYRKPIAVHEGKAPHAALGEFDGGMRTAGAKAYQKDRATLQDGRLKEDRKSTRLNSSHSQISY